MRENALHHTKMRGWPTVFLRYLGTLVPHLFRRLNPNKYCAIAEFLFLHCSSSRELGVEQNHFNNIVEESNSSGHDHKGKAPPVEERCELLSEVSMEVPDIETDTDKVVSDGNDASKVVSEDNSSCQISKENGGGNVKSVEKPSSASGVAAGKTGSGTAYLRRGRRRN